MALKLSLVIPTYNEAANIAKLCQKLINVLDKISLNFEIIIVDDDSSDFTWSVAEGLARQEPRIKVIRRMHIRGLASAVVSGWESSQGEIIGVIDADLQHPVETLVVMINKILSDHEIDIVVASRYIEGGGFLKSSFWQTLRSQLAIFLGHILVPKISKIVKDPMSGYFILRKEVIAGKQLLPVGYKILLEVLAMGSYRKVCEVPFIFASREGGKTKAGWQQYFISLLHLIKLIGRGSDNF
ncbi:MAG: polyprenol monophosphomannose synthase [Candidatus Omnitrophota bacterium]|nr:polyprenol monophosphomannose synthase [Candidatus Omnitrophota bacterium]